jgi:cobalt-zinc-cadmium efflux system membrane fusion protein
MAVLDSRELAEAKADFMAAHSREQLADKVYSREKALFEKQATSAQDVQEAEQQLTEARIALRLAEQKLIALGASTEEITKLIGNGKDPLTRYEISTPLAGVVIEKHVAKGETVNEDSDIFTIANLDTVWVNLTVYAKDIADVKKGSKVLIRADHDGTEAEAEIASITPFMDAATRTATARVVLPNQAGKWFPGTFVTGYIRHKHDTAAVAVPRDAVQTVDGQTVVFTEHDAESFELTPVTIGKSDRTTVEIVTGLKAGTRYVSQGAFHLKAMVITSTMDAHAGHGH